MERAIGAFEPLATGPRIVLLNNVALNWETLLSRGPEEAGRLLARSRELAPKLDPMEAPVPPPAGRGEGL